MTRMELEAIPWMYVPQAWPMVEPLLQRAVDQQTWPEMLLEDVYSFLMARDMQLWAVIDRSTSMFKAAGVTQILVYPRKKVARLVLVAGEDMDEWTNSLESVEAWAIANGATFVDAFCRPGLAKKLKPHGFTSVYVVVEKDLRGRLQ